MARRKITEPDKAALSAPDQAEDLPELTTNQMEFVRQRLAGKSGAEAWRIAYDATNMLPHSVLAAASRLSRNAAIMQWLSAGRRACLGTASVTLQNHLDELDRLKDIAVASGNVGAAVQAEQLRAKATGLYVERFEDLTPHDPLRTLTEISAALGGGEEAERTVAQMAKEHGIPWTPPAQGQDATTKH